MLRGIDRPLLLRAAGLTLAGVVAGLGLHAARPAGLALLGFEPPTVCIDEEAQQTPIQEVEARDASPLCGRPGVIFADTRPAPRFAAGHLAGAIHLPCDASARGAEDAIQRLSQAEVVLLYGESSEDARAVAETLRRHGLSGDLRVLLGGFAAWEAEGLACASGPCQSCTLASSSQARP